MLNVEKMLEIAKSRYECEFCAEPNDISRCIKCEKSKPISAADLREYYEWVIDTLFRKRTEIRTGDIIVEKYIDEYTGEEYEFKNVVQDISENEIKLCDDWIPKSDFKNVTVIRNEL